MVVSAIFGGLGNQLFQWAAGYNLAQLHKCKHYVDYAETTDCFGRNFLLDRLDLPILQITPEQRKKILGKTAQFLAIGFIDRMFHKYVTRNYFLESDTTNAQQLFTTKIPVYLQGYFQSETYFTDTVASILSIIRSHQKYASYKTQCQNCVAIHFRRGDYLFQGVKKQMGLCSEHYYRNALEKITSEYSIAQINVFTDDIESFEKSSLSSLANIHILSTDDPVADFYHMAAHDYIITANSTFSWWAARISQAEKIICPTPWFENSSKNENFTLPPHWVKIPKNN